MKAVKIAIIAAAVIVALAVLAWLLRDNLIERISNPLLQEYGIVVTDVSLDALATSHAGISYLELVYDEDTTVAIHELSLPIRGAADGLKTYRAETVAVALPSESNEPLDLAGTVAQFLSLSDELAGTELLVGELNVPPYPPVRNLHWALRDGEQTLDMTIDSLRMSATMTREAADVRAITLALPRAEAVDALLQRTEAGYSMEGTSAVGLPGWNPLAGLMGIVPPAVLVEAGSAVLDFDVDIPVGGPGSLSATLDPSSLIELRYQHESGESSKISVQSGSPVELSATFPDVDWSLQQESLDLLVSYEDWQDVPMTLTDIACSAAPVCSMSGNVAIAARDLPVGRVAEARLAFVQDVEFQGDDVLITVKPDAALDIRGLAAVDLAVEKIEARLASSAKLELVDAGWRLAADSLDATIESARLPGDVRVTAPVFFEQVALSELDGALAAEAGMYMPSSTVAWQDNRIATPGLRGSLSIQGAAVNADLATVGLHQDAVIDLKHDLDTGVGSFELRDAALSFGAEPLSDRISPWRDDWDLGAGTVSVDLEATWQGEQTVGRASTRITDVAGYYEDNVFAGLSTELDLSYDAAGEIAVRPSSLSVLLLDVGMPIEDIVADYHVDPTALSVEVANLRMNALGGTVRADPFSFHTDRDRNTLLLHAESIDLRELVSAEEYRAIEVTGNIGGELPVVIEGDTITITGGALEGEPSGGVIRYLQDSPPDESDVSSVALVRRALSNFEYESLSSEVDYSEDGDLKLQVRLEGRNPDMDEDRPIVLNLGVESNVPQMLRSLRATRAVEEILERRFQKQKSSQPDDGS